MRGKFIPRVECVCQHCGATFLRRPREVERGRAKYCSPACCAKGRAIPGSSVAGKRTPEYQTWQGMRGRCNRPSNAVYRYYGGRGITVCPEWDSFEQFLADMGPRPGPEYELDRKDNDGPYAAWNCRWATHTEQMNNFSLNHFIEWNGERHTIAEWARKIGLTRNALQNRIVVRGWSVERALTTQKGDRSHVARDPKTGQLLPPEKKAA
jgi:hypothetical protein